MSNLFLHYVFDKWMQKNHPEIPWCRYADDGLVHCKNQEQAFDMLEQLTKRFCEFGLELHSEKTKVVYCKDSNRKDKYRATSFGFLGYTFKPRPAISSTALKAMKDKSDNGN